MRNRIPSGRFNLFAGTTLLLLLPPLLAAGCGADRSTRQNLTAGYQALQARQYEAAMAAADEQLRRTPKGPGSAEALYLRGRAFEQAGASNAKEAQSNLQSARTAYLEALKHSPAPRLEVYIRTSLGNVAYFQDDYAAAVREWSGVYDRLDDPSVRSWVLYRVGLCQQRMGNFEQADKTFLQVQRVYPNTVPAQRAREHHGTRGFTVQLATYANRNTAEAAMHILRREGILPNPTVDPYGRTVVRVGPMQSYQQAVALKQQYAERYPDALIVP
jgi:tetratricopeptide (TPR) repeat protein